MKIDEEKVKKAINEVLNDDQLGLVNSITKDADNVIIDGSVYIVKVRIEKLI